MAENIINTLSDDILCHILSFLPTTQAVATSLLSKRWRHLWRSVTTLDFNNMTVRGERANFCFNKFVYSILLSRNANLPIKNFRLEFRDDYPDPAQPESAYLGLDNVVKWVNFVVQRRVEYLHLSVDRENWRWPKLPMNILTCCTLVVLELYSLKVGGVSYVALPSLKTLHFEFILFSKVPDLFYLLAGCPNLEDLHVIGVAFADDDGKDDEGRVWNVLAELLKHCPKLQNFDLDQSHMDEMYWTGVEGEYIWVEPEFVPQCLSLHLRTCNLLSFKGVKGELLFARYILKNANVLQTMGIWNKGLTDIKRSLSSCPRASATCTLAVYDDDELTSEDDELASEDDDVAEE